jgi:hypothetical protein
MVRKSPAIFLGDLARAADELGIRDPQTLRLVAELLGISVDLPELPQEVPAGGATGGGTGPAPRKEDEEEGEDGGAEEESAGDEKAAVREEDEGVAVPIRLHPVSGEREVWVPDVGETPPSDEGSIEVPPLDPLFGPQWARGILTAGLATLGPDGPLDVEAITEALARCEVIERVPTLPSWTLERGAQLLMDKSQAMMPFVRDQAWLLREIRNVVGEDRLEVLRFAGSPGRGAGRGARPWPAYAPPPPGTPVVLLSDLGVCQPPLVAEWAGEEEWVTFAASVSRAGCPLLAFVPYGPERWPPRLARLMNIFQWDRGTTASAVANVNRDSRGVKLP